MLMYADDTTIYCNINQNVNEIVINAELEKVNKWLCSNKFSLNKKKTKFMIFSSQSIVLLYGGMLYYYVLFSAYCACFLCVK